MANSGKQIKRLYRSRRHKVIAGVCAGLAEYFEVDVAIMRILFVLLALVKGLGLIAYIVAIFVVPYKPEETANAAAGPQSEPKASSGGHDSTRTLMIIFGSLLILIGLFYFLENLDFFPYYWFYSFPFALSWSLFWPLLLILIGVVYLISIARNKSVPSPGEKGQVMQASGKKRLFRSRSERKIAGVCGGLGAYFDVDPTIVRVLWVIGTLLTSVILGIVVYIVMALVVPEEEVNHNPATPPETGEEA